ncbi:M55 family metallopeptidase [Lactobacillus delbrueckii subsp. bulgaricus]
MEGCAGVTSWEQTHYGHKGYDLALKEMTRETVAAVKACQQAGYQVTVKDGHEDGINLDPALLPASRQSCPGVTFLSKKCWPAARSSTASAKLPA